jgi:hypothetical protein
MLIRQILEHKKGIKAVKYNKKPKAHTPAEERKVIGPDVPKKKEEVAEATGICPQCGMKGCTCAPGKCDCKPKAGYPKKKVAEGGYQHGLPDPNAPDLGSYGKREFKRREMEHELGHEDDPNFERNLRQQQIDKDRGPWYLKINGRILKSQGEPKVFDWKKGANNYALAMIKNKPALQGNILLTKSPKDDGADRVSEGQKIAETATAGATSAGHVATLGMNPKLSPGPARGKKSYTGTPGKSGTKAPPQPKVIQPKGKNGTAKNALDIKSNIFGGGKAIKRK